MTDLAIFKVLIVFLVIMIVYCLWRFLRGPAGVSSHHRAIWKESRKERGR